MSANSKIEWTDHTFNPWEGCQKIGPGCDHCYAETRNARFGGGVAANWGPGAPRRRTGEANWQLPRRWNAQHEAFRAQHGRCQRVFCASLADVFDNAVDPMWRADLFWLIKQTPNLDWLLLTKRIGNARLMMCDAIATIDPMAEWVMPLPNVWLGATVCNQEEADRDIPKLLDVPASKRFVSMEPLLGDVRLGSSLQLAPSAAFVAGRVTRDMPAWTRIGSTKLDWVIVGGESGPGARPMHPDWTRSLRDQCAAAGVPFFFKQWGEWREPVEGECFDTTLGRAQRVPAFIVAPSGTAHCFESDETRNAGKVMLRVGKKSAGRLLDGRTWDEAPA